jgi:hypothetical protein
MTNDLHPPSRPRPLAIGLWRGCTQLNGQNKNLLRFIKLLSVLRIAHHMAFEAMPR